MRLRRTELTTPASNSDMVRKAVASEADVVILDLEDSVAPEAKAGARKYAVEALRTLDWAAKTRAVRINAIDTPWVLDDVLAVAGDAGDQVDVLVVPKIRTAEDVRWFDTLIRQLSIKTGNARPIGLEVLVEDVEALINIDAIARAAPSVEALVFGYVDFAASMQVEFDTKGPVGTDPWHYVHHRIVIAAAAAGIDAVQGPSSNFRDLDGLRASTELARRNGFKGRWCIHPNQLATVADVFTPTPEQLGRALRIVQAYDEAVRDGRGAVAVDGTMIDAASVRNWRRVLASAP
jgi:citrate lyase subunit beta / citryl-CoA lyase